MGERENGGPGRYYLYVGGHDLSPSNVFFDVQDEWAAQELCGLFTDEYDSGDGDRFRYKHIATKSLRENIRLEEALDDLRLYDDPDPGIYDPPPPKGVMERAQYAQRASAWYELLLRRHDQVREAENVAIDATGSSPPIPGDNAPDVTLEDIQRLLEKHRLIFLYFAAPRRQNPLHRGEPWETVNERDLPNIPTDEIDSEGEFLFSHRRRLEGFAQAAIAKFGTGEGNVPRVMDQSGTVVEVEGGSRPYWVLDEHACLYLEESADAILDACRRAMNGNSCRPHVRLLIEVKGVLRDEGMTKWYSANLVRWRYLMRLDETIHALKTADFNVSSDASIDTDSQRQESDTDPLPDIGEIPTMPEEDNRNSGLILLLMLAQAYYTMLEATVSMASWVTMLDMELNHSYLWTVQNLTNLLKNHEHLKDFPDTFEPVLPDLYPSTIADLEWQDMIAPEVEGFLATVQKYVMSKGCYDPEENSPAWVMVELFRPSIMRAVECAEKYNKRMRAAQRRILGQPESKEQTKQNASRPPETPKPTTFATPEGATWSDVKLKLVDGETVAIKVASEPTRRFIYAELDMMDGRTQKPNKQWELLRDFASNFGTLTWRSPGAASNVKWQQRVLAKKLKAFFGIEGEPIVLTDDRKGWRTVFAIEPD